MATDSTRKENRDTPLAEWLPTGPIDPDKMDDEQ